MLSPVHLCLVLTSKYFQTPISKALKKLLPGFLSTLVVVLAIVFILR
ncbi:MAG TPA: hypothetical protein DHV12_02775 [Thermotogae bacterium]|nr:hypothetical protein [Thermotogota bacterium]